MSSACQKLRDTQLASLLPRSFLRVHLPFRRLLGRKIFNVSPFLRLSGWIPNIQSFPGSCVIRATELSSPPTNWKLPRRKNGSPPENPTFGTAERFDRTNPSASPTQVQNSSRALATTGE